MAALPVPMTDPTDPGMPAEAPVLRPMPLPPLPERPLVSILLSNYNYEQYLPEAVRSVQAQTYGHWELLAVDDGSRDGSLALLRRMAEADGRIRVFAKANGGQATGYNLAYSESRGEIIAFFDADDLLGPDKLAAAVRAHQAGVRAAAPAGFALHRIQRVDKDRRGRGVWPPPGFLPRGWLGERALGAGGVVDYMPPTAALSLHRAVAERLFPLPARAPLHGLADQTVMRLAPLLTALAPIEAVHSEYRFHAGNTFERKRITAGSAAREIANIRALWEAQHTLLSSISPEIAARLSPAERSPYLLQMEYLQARLGGARDWPAAADRYLRAAAADPGARHLWFWRATRRMPAPVFAAFVNLLLTPGRGKQLLARIRSILAARRRSHL